VRNLRVPRRAVSHVGLCVAWTLVRRGIARPRDRPRPEARPAHVAWDLELQIPSAMLLLLVILLILAAVGGGFGHSRYGYGSWSPLAIVGVILVVMLLSGRI
jgi:hypothetical protein